MSKQIESEMLDTVLAECKTPRDADSLYSQMLQRVINRSLGPEMGVHLGYTWHAKADDGRRNNGRNGSTPKTVKGGSARCRSRHRVIATAASSRNCSRSGRVDWPGLSTRSWRCTRAG